MMNDGFLPGYLLGIGVCLLIYAMVEAEKKQKARNKLTEERLSDLESTVTFLRTANKQKVTAEVH